MQIKCLPQIFYKSYHYAYAQTAKDTHVQQCRKYLGDWEILRARKVTAKEIAAITGISRATYYRLKKALKLYGPKGLEQQSRRPKKFRQSQILPATKQAVLAIRQ